MKRLRIACLLSFLVACSQALGQDARERGFIHKGMKEGEVILRIGRPDHEALIRSEKGKPEEKAWSYFPHARDPQTLTTIRLVSGVVVEIERTVVR